MRNDDVNLDILENADEETVNRLAESYSAVSESDIARLYARTERVYASRRAESSDEAQIVVSGVERYRRPLWQRIVTVVSVLVLVSGAAVGGVLAVKGLRGDLEKDSGIPNSQVTENMIGSPNVLTYDEILENPVFKMSYESFTSERNSLQLEDGPYPDAVVAEPFRTYLVEDDTVKGPLKTLLFPVVEGGRYVGFVNCDLRSSQPMFFGGRSFAPKLNDALERGSIALFNTDDGTYGIFEDNTVITLEASCDYAGSLTFEQADHGDNLVTSDSAGKVIYNKHGIVKPNGTPFGDLSGARVRFTNAAYVPYLYEATAEEVGVLAEAFCTSTWEEIDPDTSSGADGETALVFINNGGKTYRLVFAPDGTVECEHVGITTRYRVSEEAVSAAYSGANTEDTAGRLIPCKIGDLTADGVWKHSEPLPEKLFEAPALPAELEGKYFIENHPLYEFEWDPEDIEKDAAHANDLITGTVDSVSVTASNSGIAFTKIEITVTGDTAGLVSEGEKLSFTLLGGYVSMRETLNDPGVQAHASPDGFELKDYDVDNTWYHEIVGTGEVPIVGRKYGFITKYEHEDQYSLVGEEYGILYKCGDLYVQRTSQGISFYDIREIKAMLEKEAELG